jgi:hypothetical protein
MKKAGMKTNKEHVLGELEMNQVDILNRSDLPEPMSHFDYIKERARTESRRMRMK